MAKFTKGDGVKYVGDDSSIINALLADGWEQEGLLRTVQALEPAVSQDPVSDLPKTSKRQKKASDPDKGL